MLKRQLGETHLVDFDNERHSPLRLAEWERFANLFVRDNVHVLALRIRTPFHYATSKLSFAIGIVEVND